MTQGGHCVNVKSIKNGTKIYLDTAHKLGLGHEGPGIVPTAMQAHVYMAKCAAEWSQNLHLDHDLDHKDPIQ